MRDLQRREIRFPVKTASGHNYEARIRAQCVDACEGGTTPLECAELRQDEMESIVEDMKKGITPGPKVVTASEVERGQKHIQAAMKKCVEAAVDAFNREAARAIKAREEDKNWEEDLGGVE